MQGVDLAVVQVDAGALGSLARISHLHIAVLIPQQHAAAVRRAVKGGELVFFAHRQQLKLAPCRIQPADYTVVCRAVQLARSPPAPKMTK